MAFRSMSFGTGLLAVLLLLLCCASPAAAFGAGNIPSIAQIEGKNWRHGDIEDMLKTVAFIKGQKWTSMMVKRVYFGNWLRDYSQAVDVGSLKGVSAPTIRILVWVLSFLSFGYATAEFEVTEERLGVYRPEEHIDNPKDYADNKDAREYDPRLRGPVQQIELDIDPQTGMKNYIANESGGWATSTGYIKHSFARSIHFGRVYTSGSSGKGREEDLCEALRCLGQGLHCLEDFGAHTNYCELALRELGLRDVFPHCGTRTEINVRGHHVYPLVTGTFGAVDFLHSVLGEANDHFTQTEVEEMDIALKSAEAQTHGGGGASRDRSLFGSSSSGSGDFVGLVSQIPGMGGGLAAQARDLQSESDAQSRANSTGGNKFTAPGGVPGMSADFDPVKTAAKIYPILEFRDKVVRAISSIIAKIPGLEALVDKISETLTLFVLSLLAPFIRPIIEAVSASLKTGSSTVVDASANQQFEVWNDDHSTNPTHSMLSKDHFTNFLNPCAGRVATTILQYAAPRVIYAWQHPGVPIDEVMNDILRAFHHPALRDEHVEIQRNMFNTVRQWADEQRDRNHITAVLNSGAVKAGKNHIGGSDAGHSHGAFAGHGKNAGSIWNEIKTRDLDEMSGGDNRPPPSHLAPNVGSPAPSHTPDFGYNKPSSAQGHQQPPYQGQAPQQAYENSGYQNPNPPQQYGSYQQGPPPPEMGYQGGYGQPPYQQGPPPGPGGYWPPQGGPGFQGGPPPGPPPPFGGPPPGQYGQGYPGQGYPGPQYPPQGGPPYGAPGYQQYPPQGGYGGGY